MKNGDHGLEEPGRSDQYGPDTYLEPAPPAHRLLAHLVEFFGVLVLEMFMGGLGLLPFLGLTMYLWSRGTTVGKYLFHLYAVDGYGEPLGLGRMFLREIPGKLISGFFFGLGFAWILLDGRNQAWHDKIAGSIIVDREMEREAPGA